MLLRFLTSATRVRVFPVAERCRTPRSFSVCQTSGTFRSELPNWERTCQMITLTRDLNVFTSCLTTDLPAVFFSIHDVAQARNMCALSCILFRHFLLLCSYSDPLHPGLHRFFWIGDRLLHLGWSGPVWFSAEQSGGQPHDGPVGLLDAWLHAVPHWNLSADRTDMVQRLRQSCSAIYGWLGLHGLRHS